MRKAPFLLFMLLLLGVYSCKRTHSRQVNHAFYYWKSVFQLDKGELLKLDSLGITKMYVKFYDVSWDAKGNCPVPLARIEFKSQVPKGMDIIPTVFITPQSLENLPDTAVPTLANKMSSLIHSIARNAGIPEAREIQLDCDWNAGIRDKYFELIKAMRKIEKGGNVLFSATIRLHQVKYLDKTGVPPVDKGLLMYYNMGNLKSTLTRNSILENKEAGKYISRLNSYPLKLDVALPLFSWGVLFRHNRFVGLINNLRKADIKGNKDLFSDGHELYKVLKGVSINGVYLHKDDILRLEELNASEIRDAAEVTSAQIRNDTMNVALFHFDNKVLKNYTNEEILGILDTYR